VLISLSFASLPPFSVYLVKQQGGFDLSLWAETPLSPWAVSVKHNLTVTVCTDRISAQTSKNNEKK